MASPLIYRSPLATDGPHRFADWLLALAKQSGAYIIRSSRTGQTLYVGESHSGRLKDTICRHFYDWRDIPERKHYTYAPHAVEVAVRLCPPSAAITVQNKLINRLQPRDNSNGYAPEPDPF